MRVFGIKRLKKERDLQEKLDLGPGGRPPERNNKGLSVVLAEGRDQVLHSEEVADPLEVVGQDGKVDFRGDLLFPAAEEVVITKGALDRAKAVFDERFASPH